MSSPKAGIALAIMLFAAIVNKATECDFVPKGLLEKPRSEFRGHYVNEVYRYSVVIPKGLTGYDVAPPAPLHGFGLIIGEVPQSYIDVNGESNSLEYKTPADAAQKMLEYLSRHGGKVESSNLTPSRLGKLEAVELIATYSCPGSPDRYVKASTIAISPDKSTLYEVALHALASRYDRDRAILERLLKSWKYTMR